MPTAKTRSKTATRVPKVRASETEREFLGSFGKRMSVMRKEHHLTQVELADLVGLHRAYIGFIEQGRRNPSIANVKRICDALGVSLSTIFSPFDKSPRKPRLRTL